MPGFSYLNDRIGSNTATNNGTIDLMRRLNALEFERDAVSFYPFTGAIEGAKCVAGPSGSIFLKPNEGIGGNLVLVDGNGNETINLDSRISDATNATPIVITTNAAHGLPTGKSEEIVVSGVVGNTAANGTWTVTYISSTTFSLDGSIGSGAYISDEDDSAKHTQGTNEDGPDRQTFAYDGTSFIYVSDPLVSVEKVYKKPDDLFSDAEASSWSCNFSGLFKGSIGYGGSTIFVEREANVIEKFNTSGVSQGTIAVDGADGIVGTADHIYILLTFTQEVRKYTHDGTLVWTLTPDANGADAHIIGGLEVDEENGLLYVWAVDRDAAPSPDQYTTYIDEYDLDQNLLQQKQVWQVQSGISAGEETNALCKTTDGRLIGVQPIAGFDLTGSGGTDFYFLDAFSQTEFFSYPTLDLADKVADYFELQLVKRKDK